MKKILLTLVILFVIASTAKSQQILGCPDDSWTFIWYNTVLLLSNGNACECTIFYCWRDNNGIREVYLRNIDFIYKSCVTGALLDERFWESVYYKILTHFNGTGPQHEEFLPCSTGTEPTVLFEKESCSYWETGVTNMTIKPCESDYCRQIYNVCWDYTYEPPELRMTKVAQAPVGIICDNPVPYDPNVVSSPCFTNCFE